MNAAYLFLGAIATLVTAAGVIGVLDILAWRKTKKASAFEVIENRCEGEEGKDARAGGILYRSR